MLQRISYGRSAARSDHPAPPGSLVPVPPGAVEWLYWLERSDKNFHLHHRRAIDLQDGLKNRKEIGSPEIAGSVDVDGSLHGRIDNVIEPQGIADNANDLIDVGIVQMQRNRRGFIGLLRLCRRLRRGWCGSRYGSRCRRQ